MMSGRRIRQAAPATLQGSSNVDAAMMASVRDMDVLRLAEGGDEQSAVFSLMGAQVTVLDLTPRPLKADEIAAAHYPNTHSRKALPVDIRIPIMYAFVYIEGRTRPCAL